MMSKRRDSANRLILAGLAALIPGLEPSMAALHPAPAQEPKEYRVARGDTLSEISKRLFGDSKYWPKLHALNHRTIANPHLIRPGSVITYMPGTGTSLPSVAVAEPAEKPIRTQSAQAKTRSAEWKNLPRQSWESTPATLPSSVDRDGIDSTSRIVFKRPKGMDLEAISSTERLPFLAQITGAGSPSEHLTLGDAVYVRADEEIQIGETYAITEEPATLSSRKSDRAGYAYSILGKVRIIGVRDNLFIGTITSAHGPVKRGNSLIKSPPHVPDLRPTAAAAAVEGVMMLDRSTSTFTAAQHKLVFVDRGASDGVQPGMVFRAHEHHDPSNEKKITSSNFITAADMMVVQVSESFCTALIISSTNPVPDNSSVTLLTDVSDIGKRLRLLEKSLNSKPLGDELDELERLDVSGGLGKDEQKELEQLERWKGNPSPSPQADTAPPAEPPKPESQEVVPPPPPSKDTPPAAETAPAAAPQETPAPQDSQSLDQLINQ